MQHLKSAWQHGYNCNASVRGLKKPSMHAWCCVCATNQQRRLVLAVGVVRWCSILQQSLNTVHQASFCSQSKRCVPILCWLLYVQVSGRHCCLRNTMLKLKNTPSTSLGVLQWLEWQHAASSHLAAPHAGCLVVSAQLLHAGEAGPRCPSLWRQAHKLTAPGVHTHHLRRCIQVTRGTRYIHAVNCLLE